MSLVEHYPKELADIVEAEHIENGVSCEDFTVTRIRTKHPVRFISFGRNRFNLTDELSDPIDKPTAVAPGHKASSVSPIRLILRASLRLLFCS